MATPVAVPDAATTAAAHSSSSSPDHYTGVVIIHGLGDIKRSATLEEVVNTLAYWFNHQAGLALRREGPGRVWVSAKLTDDPNPDERASRASIRLAAPREPASPSAGAAGLRLEFREVWWAASFGLPSIGATIAWARVQAWEQATHLLFPIGRRLGPAHTAARAPAREVPQALTYRPMPADHIPTPPQAGGPESVVDSAHASVTRPQRLLLTAALGLYGLIQYVWKALQWLILTPLLLVLLLVMGLIRLLALIPPLRSGVVASLSSVLDYIMLHWIAEAQVYTQDYIRSAGIRERFEHEVAEFLRDERCDRVAVIAHSMGTVIAYEGLTTVLEHTEFRDSQKPITFICLAQALRRVWLMTADDPHRVRGTLPERVRWLHFWARYDPVSAGPLSARSLPRGDTWPDGSDGPTGDVPDPHEALRARLERCENVDVVNTDSAFTDHTTYWQNLEQVVGPIARELVTGHSELEQVVEAHLATPDDILLRRWRVAWRASVAIVGGLVAGLAVLGWDWLSGGLVGEGIVRFLTSQSFHEFVIALLTGDIASMLSVLSEFLNIHIAAPRIPPNPATIPVFLAQALWLWIVSQKDSFATLGIALLMTGLVILGIGKLVAIPSPFVYRASSKVRRAGARATLALSCAAAVLFIVSAVTQAVTHTEEVAFTVIQFMLPGAPQDQPWPPNAALAWHLDSTLMGIGICGLAYLVMLIDTIVSRRWVWLGVALTSVVGAELTGTLFYALLGAPLVYGSAAGRTFRPAHWLVWLWPGTWFSRWRSRGRPIGLLITSCCALIVGISSWRAGAEALGIGLKLGIETLIHPTQETLHSEQIFMFRLIWFVLGMLSASFGVGVLRLKRWAWVLGVIVQPLIIAYCVALLILGGSVAIWSELWSEPTILAAAILCYLLQGSVRRALGIQH